jgi:phenylalanyl-tRNA synthetase beta chain
LDLQDRLHHNICRKRTLVSIGTHDYDTVQGPFLYSAKTPEEIHFKALFQSSEMNAKELFEVLKSTDNKVKNFLSIIDTHTQYPVFTDSNGVVCSLPPIINSEHSKLTQETRNVLIECTATDLTKAHIVLKTLVAAFSEYTESQYTVEAVQVVDIRGNLHITPRFEDTEIDVEVDYVNRLIGVQLTSVEISALLGRMCLRNQITSASSLRVQVPITRPDVIHSCDVAEDVAIAYGYNNIKRRIPALTTTASEQPLNVFSDLVREEVARAGFTEVLTFVLISFKENYEDLCRPHDGLAVEIANPSNSDFQLPRTTLIPGLLKTLSANKTHPRPIKIFELSDCVVKDAAHPSGCKNVRRLAALQANSVAELEVIHGLLDIVLSKLSYKFSTDYFLRPSSHPTFLPGRQAEIVLKGQVIGHLGIVHPDVLDNFDLKIPVSLFEVDVEGLSS